MWAEFLESQITSIALTCENSQPWNLLCPLTEATPAPPPPHCCTRVSGLYTGKPVFISLPYLTVQYIENIFIFMSLWIERIPLGRNNVGLLKLRSAVRLHISGTVF